MSMEDNSREPGFEGNVVWNEPHTNMDVDIGGSGKCKMAMNDTIGKPNIEANEPCQFEDKILAENMEAFTAYLPIDDTNFDLVNTLADRSSPPVLQAISIDKCTRRSADGQNSVYRHGYCPRVKCMSPGNDVKPTMKVKSFIPDKYKELFDPASRH